MLSAFHQGMVHWEITTVYIVTGLLVSVIKSAKSDVCCCDTDCIIQLLIQIKFQITNVSGFFYGPTRFGYRVRHIYS